MPHACTQDACGISFLSLLGSPPLSVRYYYLLYEESYAFYYQLGVSEKSKIVMMERGTSVEESEVIEHLKDMKDENDIRVKMEKYPEPNALVHRRNQVVEKEKVSFCLRALIFVSSK
jgi:hypothetical protein